MFEVRKTDILVIGGVVPVSKRQLPLQSWAKRWFCSARAPYLERVSRRLLAKGSRRR